MQADLRIAIRPAHPDDAYDIAAVHVAAWRSTYPGILPDHVLVGMSIPQHAASYEGMIRRRPGVFVAISEPDQRVIGFSSVGRNRRSGIGDGEIHTLYVLDDWRDAGAGRRLMHAGAAHLADLGCRTAFVWVLSENASRWFYQRLGGRAVGSGTTHVGGAPLSQTAYLWDPIQTLLKAETGP